MRQYIGARYVPRFSDVNNGIWSNVYSYEPLTIVKNGNDYYTSKQNVPVGIAITNTDYWIKTGDYNGAITNLDARLTTAEDNIVDLRNDVDRLDVHIVYNVKSYGAIGDGITNDTTAVMAAVNACNATGGIVYFPAGRYKITQAIEFTHIGCSVIGENMHASYIYASHNERAIKFTGTSADTLNGCCVAHISIINLGANNVRHDGIYMFYCVNSIIDDVSVENFHVGIHLNHTGNTFITRSCAATNIQSAYGFEIENESVSSSVRDCYVVFSGDALTTGIGLYGHNIINDFLIDYLDVGNGGIGVYINAGSNGNVPAADIRLHEVVVDNAQVGIRVGATDYRGNVLIEGGWINPLIATTSSCIDLTTSENITITNVTMQQASSSDNPAVEGVKGATVKDVIIKGCRFMNLRAPIDFTSGENVIVDSNEIKGYGVNSANGIYLGTANTANIINNIVDNNYVNSINVGTGSKIIACLNQIKSIITGTATAIINSNNIVNGTPQS